MSKYESPQSFRAALEARQRKRADAAGVPLARVVQVDLYVRFLDRLLLVLDGALVVKGGVALEMRLQRARTTLDIDLRAVGDPDKLLEMLRRAGRLDRGDYLAFEINEASGGMTGDSVVYEGRRFAINATFAGKKYANKFGLDVAFGDPMVGDPEHVTPFDALSFAGIAPPTIPIYPLSTHLAEKLHAYTIPRTHVNSRLKDLIDIALIATETAIQPLPHVMEAATLRNAFETTFAFRNTHPLPAKLPPPPAEWTSRYDRVRADDELPWPTITDVHAEAAGFLSGVLDKSASGSWDPTNRCWRPLATTPQPAA